MEYYAPRLRQYARELRKNMTKEERKLWFGFLRTLPVTVKRQARIGCYIADFYIPSCRLAIELDGSQHYEEAGLEYDQRREKAFAEKERPVLMLCVILVYGTYTTDHTMECLFITLFPAFRKACIFQIKQMIPFLFQVKSSQVVDLMFSGASQLALWCHALLVSLISC